VCRFSSLADLPIIVLYAASGPAMQKHHGDTGGKSTFLVVDCMDGGDLDVSRATYWYRLICWCHGEGGGFQERGVEGQVA
jgi:hypothetical protein